MECMSLSSSLHPPHPDWGDIAHNAVNSAFAKTPALPSYFPLHPKACAYEIYSTLSYTIASPYVRMAIVYHFEAPCAGKDFSSNVVEAHTGHMQHL